MQCMCYIAQTQRGGGGGGGGGGMNEKRREEEIDMDACKKECVWRSSVYLRMQYFTRIYIE